MRRVAVVTALVLGTLAAVVVLWELRSALVLFLLAVAVSAAVRPMVDFWTARGVGPTTALALTWILGLVVPGVLVLYVTTSVLVEDVHGTADGLLRLYERIRDRWPQGNAVERLVAERLPSSDVAAVLATTNLAEVVRRTVGLGFNLFSLLGELVIVLILSILWTANRDGFQRLWLSLLPVDHRAYAQDTWFAIKRGVGEKLRSDAIESVLASVLLYLGLRAIGLEHPILPAIAGGVLRLVPVVGWLLGLVTAAIAGLVTDPKLAVAAAAYAGVVMLTLEVFVAPRFLRTRRYSSLLLTVVVLVLADAYGVFGILVAPAIAAAIQIFFEKRLASYKTKRLAAQPSTVELGERLEALKRLMATPRLAAVPELVSVVERLTGLIAATEEATGQRETSPAAVAPG